MPVVDRQLGRERMLSTRATPSERYQALAKRLAARLRSPHLTGQALRAHDRTRARGQRRFTTASKKFLKHAQEAIKPRPHRRRCG
ncbi:MAG: hypothetical protein IPI44_07685 [Sulfuritalea sp.]|nr:hypothetical protein [Sulfuritalea sp.]